MKATVTLSCEKGHQWEQTAEIVEGMVHVVAECPECKKLPEIT